MSRDPRAAARPSDGHPGRAGERGSAYLFALLALLVLTVIGLSLVVITQTEVQIGGAQKTANRVLYGADAGARIQFARWQSGQEPQNAVVLNQAGSLMIDRVDMSPFPQLYAGPCSLCSINMGSDRKFAVNHVVNSRGRRLRNISDPCSETPQASKLVSMMFFVQPSSSASQADAGSQTGPTSADRGATTVIGSMGSCTDGLAATSILY
jgi:hypothetical protein